MRQRLYNMFITNNHSSFHLRRKENLVKYQKVSKNILSMIVATVLAITPVSHRLKKKAEIFKAVEGNSVSK